MKAQRRKDPLIAARRTRATGASVALVAVAAMISACSGSSGSSGDKVQIRAILPPNTGAISSAQNKALARITHAYESKHPNVQVNWQPNPTSSITTANATLVSQASGGKAPDAVFEQYNPLLSGAIPKGILQDLRPWMNKPNPYIDGNKRWVDSFESSTVPYMTSPDGSMQILLGSNVETAFFYNKAAFAKAGITATPASWDELVQDLGKLKSAGYKPLLFGTGGPCNPSWYERLASTQFLGQSLPKFMVTKSVVTTGKDIASGIVKGQISMKNPAYAEIWKTLAALRPYLSSAGGSYDACSTPNTVSPPLSPQPPLVQGKVAMIWGGSWFIPQLNAAGYEGKYGLFAEPTITSSTSQYSAAVSTKGVIGGPNGAGQWSITTKKADSSMTPKKTKVVVDFFQYLFTPDNLGAAVKDWGQGGSYIPTVKGAPTPDVTGLESLVPASAPPTVVDVGLDGVLSTNATNTGLRLVSQLMAGGISFDSFSTKWEQVLQDGAKAYAKQNNFELSSLK